jgi:hypothetical protein
LIANWSSSKKPPQLLHNKSILTPRKRLFNLTLSNSPVTII